MIGHSVTEARDRHDDLRFLSEALELAARIGRRPWPNPPVGAVVVREGLVVGRGAHLGVGTAHAERVALDQAGDAARGATLYSTLEPCNHHGRTPPCTDAILAAGIARVVQGVADPNPQATGGAARLRQAGIPVDDGLLTAECLDLIWPFVCTDQFARPFVELKTATTLDGRFGRAGDPDGRPTYLTGGLARRDVHARRRWVDLVLVGGGTARHDHPRLDVRLADGPGDGPADPPAAGVVARDHGADVRLVRDRWLAFAGPAAVNSDLPAGAEAIACAADALGRPDVADVLSVCAARGIHAVMLEGGPRLATSFLGAGLVDRWVQYLAPLAVGDGPTWPAAGIVSDHRFHLTRCDRLGHDLRVIWDRRDFAAEARRLGRQEEAPCSPD